MGNPNSVVRFGVPVASSDGKRYSRWPRGDKAFPIGAGALVNASASTGSASGTQSIYAHIDNPGVPDDQTFVVQPTRTTDGTGSTASPMRYEQMFGRNPNGLKTLYRVIPGYRDSTGVNVDSKMPFWQPAFSGTQANPVIVRTDFPSTRTGVTAEQKSGFRRTGGAGSIFGSVSTNHWKFSGLDVPTFHGNHNGEECALYVFRGCTGVEVVRCTADGENLGTFPGGSSNGGAFFLQGAVSCIFNDLILRNIGNPASAVDIWDGFQTYDCQDCDFGYMTIEDIVGFGVFMKGNVTQEQLRNRIHHIIVRRCTDSGFFGFEVYAGSDPANWNYWYNLIADQCGNGFQLNASEPQGQSGMIVQNVCLARSTNNAIAMRDSPYTVHEKFRNVVCHNNPVNLQFQDSNYPSALGNANIEFDYNRYSGHTHQASGNFGNLTFAQWRTLATWDDNSDTNAPVFDNAGAFDWHTSGETADAPDTHGLYGSVGATIRRGAWQPAGCRQNL